MILQNVFLPIKIEETQNKKEEHLLTNQRREETMKTPSLIE